MIIPNFSNLRGANASERGIKKNYPDFYQYIIDNYPQDLSFAEKIYWYKHNISTYPICLNCSNRVKFAGAKRGYYQYCSSSCSNNNDNVKNKKKDTILDKFESVAAAYENRRAKTKQTKLERYGDENYNNYEKIKQTNLKRYGVECTFQNEDVKTKTKQTLIEQYGSVKDSYNHRIQKTKNTNLKRYGTEYVFQNEDVRAKSKQTCLERYGVENPSQSKDVKEKKKQTCLKNFGVECSFQNEGVRAKSKQTCLERYGVNYPMQNADILLKALYSKKQNIIKNRDDILDVNFENDQTIYTCSCPHPNCNKCLNKTYLCDSVCYHNRRYHNLETCTNLLNIQNIHNKGTSLELFVRDILDSYNINYISNDRSVLKKYELDIYIPSKQIAIECNGLYWHSLKEPSYHINKHKECREKGIQLLTLWEDQIIKKPEIIRSIILSKLGIYDKKIYARKCIIKEVSSKESNSFLKENHLQGNTNSSIRLGLYYNDELVSIMTFGCHRRSLNSKNESDSYELYRFCNKLNIRVIGGASKLLKYFIKNYKPKQITSFASNDISNGDLYKILGFAEIGKSNSCWFIDSKTMSRYHRYKFRKSELNAMGYNNEQDFMMNEKYLKIFDTGQLKFLLTC